MYEIMFRDKPIGCAEVKREGLYLRFICTCLLPKKGIHRIHVSDGISVKDLGICVPDGEKFILNTRIPSKYFKTDTFSFHLTDGKVTNDITLPVNSDEPFEHLEHLEDAHLEITDGQPAIILPVQDQPDSDQIQEYRNISEWT